jgi:uncharacterized protein YjbI with pentapeptide repeats
MKLRPLAAPAALTLVLLLPSAPALAECSDPASPEVNWRRCYIDNRNLRGADLMGAMLRDTTFQRSDLTGADLAGVDGYRAKFVSANLTQASFENARLIEADFTRAQADSASFVNADLRNAKMVNATLRGADFTGARVGGADFRHADLSGATWIDGKRVCSEDSVGQCN